MKKKRILLGSIFAVIILIFLSFNNVVGYRTNNSNLIHKSPLYDIRTTRTIDQDKSQYFNDYIGKGEKIKIYFPEKDNEKDLLCKYIDEISQMDKKTFNNFKTAIIFQLNKDEELKEIGIHNVLLIINLMRIYPDEVKEYILTEGEVLPQFIIILGLIIFLIFDLILGYIGAFIAAFIIIFVYSFPTILLCP